MTKEGYQLTKENDKNSIPPNTESHVQIEKDSYTWEDLDESFWNGFNCAKNKMQKRVEELEEKIKDLKIDLKLEKENKTRHKYKATFGFNDVVAFRKALKVYKAIFEAQSESGIVLNGNDDTYEKVCKALESVERHL